DFIPACCLVACALPDALLDLGGQAASGIPCKHGFQASCLSGPPVAFPSSTRLIFASSADILRAIRADPLLSKYSVIIVPEVDRRLALTDLLLGALVGILGRRPDLRLVLISSSSDIGYLHEFLLSNLSAAGSGPEQIEDRDTRLNPQHARKLSTVAVVSL